MRFPLLVHFGDNKAGSTALQLFLTNQRHTLSEMGVLYPNVGGPHFHEDLMVAYQGYDKAEPRLLARVPADIEDLRSYFMAHLAAELDGHSAMILSGEHFFKFNEAELAAFLADLRALGADPIHAVFYVREPAGKFASNVNEGVKNYNLFPDINRWQPRWRNILARWRAALGDRVTVRSLGRDSLVQGDICADFLALALPLVGLPKPRDVTGPRANVGLSAEAVVVLNRFNRYFPIPADWRWTTESKTFEHHVKNTRTSRATTRARPNAAVQRLVYRNAAADLAYLWDQFGVDVGADVPAAGPEEAIAEPFDVTNLLAAYDEDLVQELAWRVQIAILHRLCKLEAGGEEAD